MADYKEGDRLTHPDTGRTVILKKGPDGNLGWFHEDAPAQVQPAPAAQPSKWGLGSALQSTPQTTPQSPQVPQEPETFGQQAAHMVLPSQAQGWLGLASGPREMRELMMQGGEKLHGGPIDSSELEQSHILPKWAYTDTWAKNIPRYQDMINALKPHYSDVDYEPKDPTLQLGQAGLRAIPSAISGGGNIIRNVIGGVGSGAVSELFGRAAESLGPAAEGISRIVGALAGHSFGGVGRSPTTLQEASTRVPPPTGRGTPPTRYTFWHDPQTTAPTTQPTTQITRNTRGQLVPGTQTVPPNPGTIGRINQIRNDYMNSISTGGTVPAGTPSPFDNIIHAIQFDATGQPSSAMSPNRYINIRSTINSRIERATRNNPAQVGPLRAIRDEIDQRASEAIRTADPLHHGTWREALARAEPNQAPNPSGFWNNAKELGGAAAGAALSHYLGLGDPVTAGILGHMTAGNVGNIGRSISSKTIRPLLEGRDPQLLARVLMSQAPLRANTYDEQHKGP